MKRSNKLSELLERLSEVIEKGGTVWVWYSKNQLHNAERITRILAQAWIPVALSPPGVYLNQNRKNTLQSLIVSLHKTDLALFIYDESDITPLLDVIPTDLKNNIILLTDSKVQTLETIPADLIDEFTKEDFTKKYHDKLNYLRTWHSRMIRNEVPYRRMMEAVIEALPEITGAVDLGCGIGLCMRPLKQVGINVKGFDYSAEVIKEISRDLSHLISYGDLTKPINFTEKYDLVICVEVAEHLQLESAVTLIDNIDTTGAKFLLFSAATPGQGGTGHLNEQEIQYWEKLLEEKGFRREDKITKSIVDAISEYNDLIPWLVNNIAVYKRH